MPFPPKKAQKGVNPFSQSKHGNTAAKQRTSTTPSGANEMSASPDEEMIEVKTHSRRKPAPKLPVQPTTKKSLFVKKKSTGR